MDAAMKGEARGEVVWIRRVSGYRPTVDQETYGRLWMMGFANGFAALRTVTSRTASSLCCAAGGESATAVDDHQSDTVSNSIGLW